MTLVCPVPAGNQALPRRMHGILPMQIDNEFSFFFCPHSTPFSYHFLLMIIPPPSPKASLAYTHITHFGLYAYWLYILFNVFSLRFSGVIMRFYFLLCMLLICGHLDFLNSYWCSCHMLFSFVIQIFWILGDNFSCHIGCFVAIQIFEFLMRMFSFLVTYSFFFVIQIFWNCNDLCFLFYWWYRFSEI